MSQPRVRNNGTVLAFDAARAIAALAVLAAHARSMLIVDAGEERDPLSLAAAVFLGVTSLGHQAVIVFLVVSGAVITRSMLARGAAGNWSAGTFATARLTRLWVALLPCLLVGGLEDRLGITLAAASPTMSYGLPGSSAGAVLGRLNLPTLMANLGFLQGLRASVFGSNAPLWTLAVEAWCYAGAAMVFSIRREPRSPRAVILAIGATVAASWLLPPSFWVLVPVWLAGAGTALLRPISGPACPSWARALLLVIIAFTIPVARLEAAWHGVTADYGLALAVACGVVLLADWRPRGSAAAGLLRRVADVSYTLYLSHVPLLAFLAAVIVHGTRLPLGRPAVLLWVAGCGLALLHAKLLWWLFERHTGRVRAAAIGFHQRIVEALFTPQEVLP